MELTRRAKEVLRDVARYTYRSGRRPYYRDLVDVSGTSLDEPLWGALKELERAGKIRLRRVENYRIDLLPLGMPLIELEDLAQ